MDVTDSPRGQPAGKNTPIEPRVRQIGRSVAFATLITVLGAITGLFGSLYADEIKSAFPFSWGAFGSLSVQAIVFWLLLVGTSACYAWRQRSVDAARLLAESRLEKEAAEIQSLIRTLPPRDFLEAFQRVYASCSAAVFDFMRGDETRRADPATQAIVEMLVNAMVGLARHYDGTPNGVVYAGNIMTFEPIESIPDPVPTEYEEGVHFLGGPIHQKRGELAGLLKLRIEYSVRVVQAAEHPDSKLSPLWLPVPREPLKRQRSRALPGAPHAYCFKEPNLYEDTTTMADFCNRQGDFLPSVIDELQGYFDPARSPEIRSLASFPIPGPEGEPPLGVVNIHRDQEGILRKRTGVGDHGSFFLLMDPLAHLLAHVLAVPRLPASKEEGRPAP